MSAIDLAKIDATAASLRLVVEAAAMAWPQPTAITAELPPAPPFDGTTLLPKVLRDFVLDEADRMPTSPDYVAAALMTALGSVIGARAAIKPKRRDDWIQTPNLFGGVVGDPSTKKTPAIAAALRFLDRLDAKEAERHTERLKIYEAELVAFDARKAAIQAAMKKAASGKGDGLKMNLAVDDLQALMPPEKPGQRRFKINDGTVAKIGDILASSPAGLMVFRDELVGLLASWDKDGNEGDRAFYLEAFNGTSSFSIDRIGRGSQHIPTLCLSVFGGIQPELLERYLATMVNSLDNDGRIQRFQMLVYPEPVAWSYVDRHPVQGAREAIRDLFERLSSFDPVQDGAQPANEFVKLPWFSFDDKAQEVFIEWATELHLSRIAAEQNPLMRQHLAKFERLFCAIALILHLAEGRIGAVQTDTALRAAAWCAYLEGHARRVYGLVEVAKVSAAKTLSRRMLDRKLPLDGFTAREVMRKGWVGLKTALEAESALAVLEEHGWVVASDTAENIGRPTTKYYINPQIFGGAP